MKSNTLHSVRNLAIILAGLVSLVMTSGVIGVITDVEFFQLILFTLLFGIHGMIVVEILTRINKQ